MVSPGTVLYDGRAEWVQVPLEDGLVGIWPGHSPMIGTLGKGTVEFVAGEARERIDVAGGVLRVSAERCVILVTDLPEAQEVPVDETNGKAVLFDRFADSLHEALTDEEIEDLQDG